jgi:hypothetical protein
VTAWRAEVQKLSQDELNAFLRTDKPGDLTLEHYAGAVGAVIDAKVKTSKSIRAAQWLRPLFEFMKLYAPIGTTISALGPSPCSLIFGGVTCLFSISIRFVEYQEKLVEMLSGMISNLAVVSQYKGLFLQNAELQKALVIVYADILRFCVEASKLFMDDKGKVRSGVPLFRTSVWRPFESKFGELSSGFKEHLATFERHVMLANSQRIADLHKMQVATMGYQEFAANELTSRFISVEQSLEEGDLRKQFEEDLRRLQEVQRSRG